MVMDGRVGGVDGKLEKLAWGGREEEERKAVMEIKRGKGRE